MCSVGSTPAPASSRATVLRFAPALTSNVYGETGNASGCTIHQPSAIAVAAQTSAASATTRAKR